MFAKRNRLKVNKRIKAALWSRVSYHYLNTFFALGRSKPLLFEDCWELDDDFRAEQNSIQIEAEWAKELIKDKPNLSRAIFRANKGYILPVLIIHLFILSSRVAIAFITQPLLEWLVLGKGDNSVYIYVGLLALLTIVRSTITPVLVEYEQVISHQNRVQLNTMLYKKILKLSLDGYNQTSIGTMVNYIANDTMFYEKFSIIGFIVAAPVTLITAVGLLIHVGRWPAVIGLGIYMVLFVCTTLIGGKMGSLRSKTGQAADKRLTILEEMLNAIQVVKMYCWEKFFVTNLVEARQEEIKYYKIQAILQGMVTSFSFLSSHLLVIFVYVAAFYLDDYEDLFTTSIIFTILMLSNNIQGFVKIFTFAVFLLKTFFKANERIQKGLMLPEDDKINIKYSESILFDNYKAGYKEQSGEIQICLENLSFEVSKGQLLGVIGPVGSGKTSLLNCLIGETVCLGGSMHRPKIISVTTQEAWVFGGTIKENILMNLPFQKSRYDKIVESTCLNADFKQLSNGDETVVGEKGVTLSGGQVARVSLAR